MIPVGSILLCVQHFQERGGRIASIIGAHLVHLVQKQEAVFCSRLRHGGHNPPRHRAHIGLSVASDVRFIMNAAQRNPRHFAVQASGDGVSNGSFAHAWRTHQTDNLPWQLRRHLLDCQGLQNSLLYWLQAKMIIVQNLSGYRKIHPFLRPGIPGKLRHNVQIVC